MLHALVMAQNYPERPREPKMAQGAQNGREGPDWLRMTQRDENASECPKFPTDPRMAQ